MIALLKWLVKFNIMACYQRNHLVIPQTNGRKGKSKLFQTFTSWKRLDLDSQLKVTGCFLTNTQFVSSKYGRERVRIDTTDLYAHRKIWSRNSEDHGGVGEVLNMLCFLDQTRSKTVL